MAKQSPLVNSHKSHGAEFVEQDGWQLPDHFGDTGKEYAAARAGAGLFDLAHRAMLQFAGPDRLSFLQGMLSNDLRTLRMFEGQQAALLTQQGKVVAEVRVLCAMNSIYLDFWEALKEKTLAHLNRYLVADEVEILDTNEQWKVLSLQGPRAAEILRAALAPADLPGRAHQHAMIPCAGSLVCVVHADHYGSLGYDIIVQTAQLEEFAQRLTDLGALWCGERAWNTLRVEAGVARYGVDFDEDNLLLEVGLNDAVSFTKGCYLGQEVIERIRSRGHVNRKLCGLRLFGTAPVPAGAALRSDDKTVGRITSSVLSPALACPIALGYVNKEFWQPGTKIQVGGGGENMTTAEVTALPFVQAKV